jgi:hypothetical protein
MPKDWGYENDMAPVAYAESDDGVRWTKPTMKVLEHGPGPNHLTDLGLHCPSVYIDPHAPASRRYRATGCGYKGLHLCNPKVTDQGYYTAHSSDGLRWELDSTKPTWGGADVITSVWHPGRNRAVIALKHTPRRMRIRRRSIWTAELTSDGAASEPVSALLPDEYDDLAAAARGHTSADYYGMGMLPTGQGTVGFLWHYWHDLPYTSNAAAHVALYGTSDVTLTYQAAAGHRWLHMPGRPDFIAHGHRAWSSGWINTASTPVEMGDEHWLYFSGTNTSHGFYLDPSWKRLDRWADYADKAGGGCIGIARWPKWRLFGFQSDPEGTIDIDLGVVTEPSELLLNYTTRSTGGSIRVELVGVEGRSLADSVPMEHDGVVQPVAWRTGTCIAPHPQSRLTARVHLQCATVYANELRRLA